MKRLIISIYLIVLIIFSSSGQNVTVTTAFDSARIYIGDQIKFTITVDQPSNLRLTLPSFKDTLVKDIEILSGPVIDSSSIQKGRTKIIQKYLITSFDSGRYQVRPVIAEIKSEGGIKRYYSDYSVIDVMRVKIAPADTVSKIFDIIKPYRAPVTLGEVLPWLLIGALVGAIIWIAIRFFKKFRRSKAGVEALIPADPAHVIAFRELEKLREEELWQKGETKKYYTKLTEILRLYLENRFRVYSLELTTAETLEALVKTGFRKDGTYNDLKIVLTGADLVKFAKYAPVPSENESHFQNSWNFIETTRENESVVTSDDEKKSIEEAKS